MIVWLLMTLTIGGNQPVAAFYGDDAQRTCEAASSQGSFGEPRKWCMALPLVPAAKPAPTPSAPAAKKP